MKIQLTRAVIVAAATTSVLGLGACSASNPSVSPESPQSSRSADLERVSSTKGALDVTLTAAESQVPYGAGTRWAMTYNGHTPGPTLTVHPGDHMNITLVNHLDEPTSLHTHGLHVPPSQDNPFLMVEPGQSYTYRYDIPADQQAGTYWYHPHVHGSSAEQVAAGLVGAILVEDDTDSRLAKVSTDRVLVVDDPPLVQSNPRDDSTSEMHMGGMHMGGPDQSGGDMMTAMVGRSGPRLLTNGQDGVTLPDSGGRLERVHVVNASASTRLLLEFSGTSMVRLSTSGGRLPSPQTVRSVDLSPGDRTELVLVPGVQGGHLTAQRVSNEGHGRATGNREVLATVAPGAGTAALPSSLQANTRDLFGSRVRVARHRTITLDGHMRPTIDGQPFDPGTVNLYAKKGTVEEWTIKSNSPMEHPIHLHSWPFQVQGEQGWQDVVMVPAYGSRTIRVPFDDFGGTTVLHCHILDHEDNGMMAVIRVQ